MPDTSTNDQARTPPDRSARGVKLAVVLLSLLLLPAGIYALYVVGQISDIQRHDMRGLDATARAAEDLLDNLKTTVRNLRDAGDAEYACEFFLRQTRLRLVEPSCDALNAGHYGAASSALRLETSGDTVRLVGCDGGRCLRIEVLLGALLEQIPFGATFDQLLIADQKGRVLGSAVSPQRDSPMLPPRASAIVAAPSVRAFTVPASAPASEAASQAEAAPPQATLAEATEVRTVAVGGTRYTLMCQPWRVQLTFNEGDDSETWRVCGLKDSRESFRRALEVAPYIVIVLLAFLTFAIVSWPILKLLSLAPEERIRFVDMYLTLLATLGLVMLLSAGIADVATHATVGERSQQRLQELAREIDRHLRAELIDMRAQLETYDGVVASWLANRGAPLPRPARIGCVLLPPANRTRDDCEKPGDDVGPPPPLGPPAPYLALESAYWMRPCDGWQIVKLSSRFKNTPTVRLDSREYFRVIKRGQAWPFEAGRPMFVDTAASITTGEFFTALSIKSDINGEQFSVLAETPRPATLVPDCTEDESGRFAVAVSGQPVSMRHPVLAPGVGFAIADHSGRVLYHSDERRAAVDNLFDDDGLAPELRAALAAGSDAHFRAYYQTRAHDVYVHPLAGLPWAVVTFLDDQVLRSFHVELLGRAVMLIAAYWLLALLGTLLYMAAHGREPPIWMWPRHHTHYRPIYHTTVAALTVLLAVFLVALDYLHGVALLFVCGALPLSALATVHCAARAAKRAAKTSAVTRASAERLRAQTHKRLKGQCAWIAGATIVLVVVAAVAMVARDRLSTSIASFGIGTVAAVVLMGVFLVVARGDTLQTQLEKLEFWKRRRDDPLTPHVIGTALVWLLIGALPAAGLFELAFARETVVATKLEQGYLARAYAWQACRKQEDRRHVVDAVRPPVLDPQRRDVYDSARFAKPASTDGADLRDDAKTVAAQLWRVFAYAAPVYNESTIYKRYLDPLEGESRSRWSWSFADPDGPVLVYDGSGVDACGATLPEIASRLPPLEPEIGWLRAGGVLVFVVLLVAWVSFGVRKLFFGDVEPDADRRGRLLDPHLGGLGVRPTKEWVDAEVEPIQVEPIQVDSILVNRGRLAAVVALWRQCATRRSFVDKILDEVRPLYEMWWRQCSPEEKLVLIQLVEEGFANPKQGEIVRRLLRKGLLRRDPVLRPVNHSFAVFVDSIIAPADLERETPHRGLRLTGVRGVLLAALVLVLLFLSITQQDTVQVWVAYLTTTAAGAFGVLKLMSFVSRPSIKAE